MPFPRVVGKGAPYKVGDLFRKFTKEEVEKIVRKIECDEKIPYLVFVKKILESAMDLSGQKTPFWFIPFVITGRDSGVMLYFCQDGFWTNRKEPNILTQSCHSDWIKMLDVTWGHAPEFVIEAGQDPTSEVDEDDVTTMQVKFRYENKKYEFDIAELHGKGYGAQLRIIEAIWGVWKTVVEESKDASSYMFDPAMLKDFNSWQEVIDWAFLGQEEAAAASVDDGASGPDREELEKELLSAENCSDYSDIAYRIARDLGDVEGSSIVYKKALELAEDSSDFRTIASSIAKKDGLHDLKWARQVFKQALGEAKDTAALSQVADDIADTTAGIYQEWARQVFSDALGAAEDAGDMSYVASYIARRDGLNDQEWAREIFKKTIDKAIDSEDFERLLLKLSQKKTVSATMTGPIKSRRQPVFTPEKRHAMKVRRIRTRTMKTMRAGNCHSMEK